MNAAVATIVVAVVGVIGTILGATAVGVVVAGRDDADIANKTEVWERTSRAAWTLTSRTSTPMQPLPTKPRPRPSGLGAFIDNMEAWANELAQQVSVPAESQRRARVMFTAARHSHLSHNSRD